jgi:hypothetical protein
MSLWRRALAFALLAPMLVLAVSAYGFVGLRCRMTGMVSLSTCCPESDPGQPPAQTSISEPGCCDTIVIENAKPPADTATPVGDDLLSAACRLAAPSPVAVVALPVRSATKYVVDPPPIPRPPLHLLKRSLLI